MSPAPQLLLGVHQEIVVDLFSGGGGASEGIRMATGREPDVAINHDEVAIAMHRANHPTTKHHTCDIFEVDPVQATGGRPVGLLWASPDCTDHSKAKGGAPTRNTRRRSLAWVVTRWAGQVRPRVIMLENVEEFTQWGPLVGSPGDYRRCPKRKGKTFRRFVRSLEDMGYEVDHRELRACNFGAPTIRKRMFLIARCDGEPIVWPDDTHGPDQAEPFRTTAECIDWSQPMCSVFATPEEAKAWGREHGRRSPRRPLADKTMARIARGVQKYVVDAAEPFIVGFNHGDSGGRREYPLTDPVGTVETRNKYGIVAPFLAPRYGERPGQAPRSIPVDQPHPVIVPTGNGGSLVAPYLIRHWGGMTGKALTEPMPTVLTKGAQDQLLACHLQRDFGQSVGSDLHGPMGTITATGMGKAALVASFISKYYGQGTGSALDEPAGSLTTKDRLSLITVWLQGEPYVVVDIAMRMLTPKELYRLQGFSEDYKISNGTDEYGHIVTLTQTEQVRLVGNSVSPQCAMALVQANAPSLSILAAA